MTKKTFRNDKVRSFMNILSATPPPLKPTSYLNYIVNGRVAAPNTHKTHNFHATARKNFSTTEKQTPLQGPKPHNFFFAASPRTTGASLGEAPLPQHLPFCTDLLAPQRKAEAAP